MFYTLKFSGADDIHPPTSWLLIQKDTDILERNTLIAHAGPSEAEYTYTVSALQIMA